MTLVKSSTISAVHHDGKQMTVRFKNGGTYDYPDVPQHLYDRMMAAHDSGESHREILPRAYQDGGFPAQEARGCEMTDIVERLRNPSGMEEGESISNVVARFRLDMAAAADEIERLRATIEQLRSVAGAVSLNWAPFDQIKAGGMTPIETGGRPIGEVVDPYGTRKTPS